MLRTLALFDKLNGQTDGLKGLRDRGIEFLLSERRVENPFGAPGIGFGDPVTQDQNTGTTISLILSTATALLALAESHAVANDETAVMIADELTSGVEYLLSRQEQDQSWNHRAFDTALALRLLRPDLKIINAERSPDGTSYVVTLKNSGFKDAVNFVVSSHREDPLKQTLEERIANRLGVSPYILNLAIGEETAITVPISLFTSPVFFMVDGGETVPELFEKNNVLRLDPPLGDPDLAVFGVNIRFGHLDTSFTNFTESAGALDRMTTWTIEVTVRNIGGVSVPVTATAVIEAYVGDPGSNPFAPALHPRFPPTEGNAGGWPRISALSPGQTAKLWFIIPPQTLGANVDFPIPGTYPIGVKINGNGLKETTLTNNVALREVRLYDGTNGVPADLVIAGPESIQVERIVEASGTAPAQYAVRVLIENQGGRSAQDPQVELWTNNSHPQRLVFPGNLAAGEAFTAEFFAPISSPGAELLARASLSGGQSEITLDNNQAVKSVGVSPGGAYDLAVGITTDDIAVRREANCGGWTVEVTVRNLSASEVYDPANLSALPLLRLLLLDGDSGALTPRALNRVIPSGGYYTLQWTNVPFLTQPASQPNRLKVEILNNPGDATNFNDAAIRNFHLPEVCATTFNLRVTDLSVVPQQGAITDAAETEFPFTFAFTAWNDHVSTMSNVTFNLHNDVTGEVVWQRTMSAVPPVSKLPISVIGVKLPAGIHSIVAAVDPQNRVFETLETDNETNGVTATVTDEAVRVKADLRYTTETVLAIPSAGRVTFIVDVTNATTPTLEGNQPIPQAAEPFYIALYEVSSGMELGRAFVSDGLRGGEHRAIIVPDIDPAHLTTSVRFKLDPTSPTLPLGQVDESNELNNELTIDFYTVPPPDGALAVAFFQEVDVSWKDSPNLDTPGYMPTADLLGYRVTLTREGGLPTTRFYYAETDGMYQSTDTAYLPGERATYQIVTVSKRGWLSAPVTLPVQTSAAATLRVLHDELELINGQRVVAGDPNPTVDIEVTADGADEVEIFANGMPTTVTAFATPDGHRVFTLADVPFEIGTNRYFARPVRRLVPGGPVKNGAFTSAVVIIRETGVDLTASPAQLEILMRVGGLGGQWTPVPLARLNRDEGTSPSLNPRFIVRIPIHNVEGTAEMLAGPFNVHFEMTVIDSAGNFSERREITVPGVSVDGGGSFVVESDSRVNPGLSNFRKPRGYYISEIRVTIDPISSEFPKGEVEESFENNNSVAVTPLECAGGSDIMVVLDTSWSMSYQTRMESAKRPLHDFVKEKLSGPQHKVGLVTFDVQGDLRDPLDFPDRFKIRQVEPQTPVRPCSSSPIDDLCPINTQPITNQGTKIDTGLNLAWHHMLYGRNSAWTTGTPLTPPSVFSRPLRPSADPVILLVDDSGGMGAPNIAKPSLRAAAALKRDFLTTWKDAGGKELRIFNLHVTSDDGIANEPTRATLIPSTAHTSVPWIETSKAMFMRQLSSGNDVVVSDGATTGTRQNWFRVEPYFADDEGPVALKTKTDNSGTTIFDDRLPGANTYWRLKTPTVAGFNYKDNYLFSLTQILAHQDVMTTSSTGLARFRVDRDARVIILWPSASTTTPGWMSGWSRWLRTDRYGHALPVDNNYNGLGYLLGNYRIAGPGGDATGTGAVYHAYIRNVVKNEPIVLGGGRVGTNDNFYAVFVVGDPSRSTTTQNPDPYVKQVSPLPDNESTTSTTTIDAGVEYVFKSLCHPDGEPDQLPDMTAEYWDEAPVGETPGFPGGFPAIGETARLVGRVANDGFDSARRVEYRFRVGDGLTTNSITDTSGGWGIDGWKLLAADPLAQGLSATVEVDWTHPDNLTANSITFVLEVKTTDTELTLTNNRDDFTINRADECGDYPDFKWASDSVARVVQTNPDGASVEVGPVAQGLYPIRYRKNAVLRHSLNAGTEGVFGPDIKARQLGEVCPASDAAGTTISATSIGGIAGTNGLVDFQFDGLTPPTTPTPFKFDMIFAEDDLIAFNTPYALTRFDLNLNPASPPDDFISEGAGLCGDDDSNTTTGNARVVLQFQDAVVTNFERIGIEPDGRIRLRAEVTRGLDPVFNYPFEEVAVSLLDTTYAPDANMADYPARYVEMVAWTSASPAIQTVDFLWSADERTTVTLCAVADLQENLAENPNGGRANNYQCLILGGLTRGVNLIPVGFELLNGSGGTAPALESCEDGLLRLTAEHRTAVLNAPSTTYKARFWAGHPLDPASLMFAELPIVNHEANTARVLEQLWKTAGLGGDRVLYAELDPPSHVAAFVTGELPGRAPLSALQLWNGPPDGANAREIEGIIPSIARASEISTAWRVRVSVAANGDSTTLTTIGEWVSSMTTLPVVSFADQPGPLHLALEAIQDPGLSGVETLPVFSAGDSIRVALGDLPVGAPGTTPTLVTAIEAMLPESSDDHLQKAVALWVADDGATYFANSMHTANDFNQGGGTSALTNLTPLQAMVGTTGSLQLASLGSDDSASTAPLNALQLWDGLPDEQPAEEGIIPSVARASEILTPWRVRVGVASGDDSTSVTTIGEWDSTTNTLPVVSFAPAAGPMLLTIEAIQDSELPGDEWLPVFSAGDSIRVALGYNPLDGPGTTPTLVTAIEAMLPVTSPEHPQKAVALWVADDGATYFANSMHLSQDFNYGGGSTALVDMGAATAMGDTTGRVAESDETDNMILLTVSLTDCTVYDMAAERLTAPPVTFASGELIPLTLDLMNVGSAHNDTLQVVFSIVGGEVLATESISAAGGWDSRETGTFTFNVIAPQDSGTVPIQATLLWNRDSNASNNTATTTVEIAGNYDLNFSDPVPEIVVTHEDVATSLSVIADPQIARSSLRVWIETPLGVRVANVTLPSSQDLEIGTTTLPLVWNTGSVTPGVYRFAAELVNESTGTTRASDVSTTFTIVSDCALTLHATTDKTHYAPGETVTVDIAVTNAGAGALNEATSLAVSVQTADGNEIQRFDESIVSLAAGETADFHYELAGLSGGEYRVTAEAINAEPCAQDSAAQTFFMGGAGLRPAETLEIADPVSSLPLIYTNQTTATLLLGNLGPAVMSELDFMEVGNEAKPEFVANELFNGDLRLPAFDLDRARGWYEISTGFEARREAVGSDWALLAESAVGFISNSPSLGVESNSRDASVRIEPLADYTLSFAAGSSTTATLEIVIHQYDFAGNFAAEAVTATFEISSGSLTEKIRFEKTFRSSSTARFVDVGLRTLDNDAQIMLLMLSPGKVAPAWRNRTTDERTNLIVNSGFTVDAGIDFSLLQSGILLDSDQVAANGIPDGWFRLGGLSAIIPNDPTVPERLNARGLKTSLLLSEFGGQSPVLAQGYLAVEPGAALHFKFAAKGTGQAQLIQFDAELNAASAPPTSISIASTDWSDYSTSITLAAAATVLAVLFGDVPATDTLALAGLELRDPFAADLEWSGWIPYSMQFVNWKLKSEGPDGPRSSHARYLTQFGRMSHEGLIALTRDADGNGAADARTSSTLLATIWDEDVPTTQSAVALTDGITTTSLNVMGKSGLDLDVHMNGMTYADTLRVAGTLGEEILVRVMGSLDGEVYLPLAEFTLAAGLRDQLLRLSETYPIWRIQIIPAGSATTLDAQISEIELRGLLLSGDDTVILDRTAPVLTIGEHQPDPSNEPNPIEFTGTIADNLSGIATGMLQVRIENGGNVASDWSAIAPFDPSTEIYSANVNLNEGANTVRVRATDRAGNESVVSDDLFIDRTSPTLTLTPHSPDPTNESALTYGGTALDTNGSGVSLIQIRVDNGSWVTVATENFDAQSGHYTHALDPLADGLHLIEARAIDSATNVSAIAFDEVTVDTIAPEVTLAEHQPDPTTERLLVYTGTALDTIGTGVASVEIRVDEGTWIAVDNFDAETGVFSHQVGPLTTGVHVIEARATDYASNMSEPVADTVTVIPAPIVFCPPVTLNSNAATDTGDDILSALGTDKNGVWIAVWSSNENLNDPALGLIGTDFDLLFARSVDNGLTWSAPKALNLNAAVDEGDDVLAQIANDGRGHWIAVWTSNDTLGDTIGSDEDVLYSASDDNGITWSAPAPLNTNAATDSGDDANPQVFVDESGNWMAVWTSDDTLGGTKGSDLDVLFARSVNGGTSWSAPAPVHPDALSDSGVDAAPQIIESNGVWLAIYESTNPVAMSLDDSTTRTVGTDSDILAALTADQGATWIGPFIMNKNAETDAGDDTAPQIAVDGERIVIVWESTDTLGGTTGTDRDILYAFADEDGLTTPAALNSNAAVDSSDDALLAIATDGETWKAVWTSSNLPSGGTDDDLLVVSSLNGLDWTPVEAFNGNFAIDAGDDQVARIVADRNGHWVVIWSSNDCLSGAEPSIGDFNIFVTTNSGECPEPQSACATPTLTPTVTPTASPTASPSASPTASATPSPTASGSPTASASPSDSPTASPSASPSASASPSPTPSESPTASVSPSKTPTASASPSASPSRTATPTSTATASASATPSPSPTSTASPTATSSPTASASPTPGSGCPDCSAGTVTVNSAIELDASNLSGTAGALASYASFDGSTITIDLGARALVITTNGRISVLAGSALQPSQFHVSGNHGTPNLTIKSTCTLTIDPATRGTSEALYRNLTGVIETQARGLKAGDISLEFDGGITVNGGVQSFQENLPDAQGSISGAITFKSQCGDIVFGPASWVVTWGENPGTGAINVVQCGTGNVIVNGLVMNRALHTIGNNAKPTINVAAFGGDVTVNGRNLVLDELTISGTKYDVTSGLLAMAQNAADAGKINIQASGNISVSRDVTALTLNRTNFAALATYVNTSTPKGGQIKVRSINGTITAKDRALQADGKGDNSAALIELIAAGGVTIQSPTANDSNHQVALTTAAAAINGTAKGGTNRIQSCSGTVEVQANAQVTANGSSQQGFNYFTAPTVTVNGSATVTPSNTSETGCSGVTPLFEDCDDF